MAHIQPVTYVSRTKDNLTLLTVCILADFQLLQPCPAEQSCTLILFCSWHSTLIPGITWGPCMFVFPTRLEAPGGEDQCLFYFLYLLILEGERKEGERKEGRERGRKREREKERWIDLLFHLLMHSLVDSCMCPDQESNLRTTLAYQNNTPTNLATRPGAEQCLFNLFISQDTSTEPGLGQCPLNDIMLPHFDPPLWVSVSCDFALK